MKIRNTPILVIEETLALKVNDKVYEHSLRVKQICQNITTELEANGLTVRKRLLDVGSLLHDIGKCEHCNIKYHHYISSAMMMNLFNCTKGKKNIRFAQRVQSLILSHKGAFCPHPCVAKEAAILRMADKIDHFVRKKDDSKKYERNLNIVEQYFKALGLEGFEELKNACDSVKESYDKR